MILGTLMLIIIALIYRKDYSIVTKKKYAKRSKRLFTKGFGNGRVKNK